MNALVSLLPADLSMRIPRSFIGHTGHITYIGRKKFPSRYIWSEKLRGALRPGGVHSKFSLHIQLHDQKHHSCQFKFGRLELYLRQTGLNSNFRVSK